MQDEDSATANYYIIEAVKETVKLLRYFYFRNVRYDYDTPQGKGCIWPES